MGSQVPGLGLESWNRVWWGGVLRVGGCFCVSGRLGGLVELVWAGGVPELGLESVGLASISVEVLGLEDTAVAGGLASCSWSGLKGTLSGVGLVEELEGLALVLSVKRAGVLGSVVPGVTAKETMGLLRGSGRDGWALSSDMTSTSLAFFCSVGLVEGVLGGWSGEVLLCFLVVVGLLGVELELTVYLLGDWRCGCFGGGVELLVVVDVAVLEFWGGDLLGLGVGAGLVYGLACWVLVCCCCCCCCLCLAEVRRWGELMVFFILGLLLGFGR